MKCIYGCVPFLILTAVFTGWQAQARALSYFDGGDHFFDGDADSINVADSLPPSPQPTTVRLGPNAVIMASSGGQTAGRVNGSSVLEVQGSRLRSTGDAARGLWGEDHSRISAVGATVLSRGSGAGLYLSDDAQGIVENSSISATNFHGVSVLDRARLTILSGVIGSTGFGRTTLQVGGQAVVDIHGGIFTEGPFSAAGFDISAAGQIHLYGYGFTLDGVPAPAGPVALGPFVSGVVAGTLSNGDLLDTTYLVFEENAAAITFHIIPEPGCGLLICMGVMVGMNRGWTRLNGWESARLRCASPRG